jgi:hypothetical protein
MYNSLNVRDFEHQLEFILIPLFSSSVTDFNESEWEKVTGDYALPIPTLLPCLVSAYIKLSFITYIWARRNVMEWDVLSVFDRILRFLNSTFVLLNINFIVKYSLTVTLHI